jgi:hypothetical protein
MIDHLVDGMTNNTNETSDINMKSTKKLMGKGWKPIHKKAINSIA